MQSLYVDADTWLHRRSPRLKLAILAALGIGLAFIHQLPVIGGAAALAALAYFRSGVSFGDGFKRLRWPLITIAVVGLFNLVFNAPHDAAEAVLRLVTLVLAAATVTATTTLDAFMDEITRIARPLEMTGMVKASDIGLAVGLVIRFVPDILQRYQLIKDAHEARGLKINVATTLAPLIIHTLRDADSIAAAIDARGVRRHL